jgi:hypothetical protein
MTRVYRLTLQILWSENLVYVHQNIVNYNPEYSEANVYFHNHHLSI